MATPEEEQAKLLLEALQKFGAKTNALADAFEKLTNSNIRANSNDITSSQAAQRQRIAEINVIKTGQAEFKKLADEVKKGIKTQDELEEKYRDQIKAIEEHTELTNDQKDSMKAALDVAKARGRAESDLANRTEQYSKAMETAGKIFAPIADAGSKVIQSYTSGASNLSLAGSTLQAGAGLTSAALSGTGDKISEFGKGAVTSASGKVKALGVAAMVAGGALSAAGSAMGIVAQKVLPVLQGELEKFSTAFNTTSSAGALFADGLTGMINAAGDAGLRVDDFAKVIDQNKEAIAQSGLGMAGGAQLIGKVGKTLEASGVQKELMNLGFSLQDQAAMTANVAAQMRKTSGQMLSDKEVAPAVAEYAKNLRMIASITGEDVESKTKAAEKANQELALQAQLAKMGINQADFNQAMGQLTEQEQKNLRDRIVLGEVVNKEGAIAEATNKAMGDKGQALFAALQQGQFNASKVADIITDFGPAVKKDALALADSIGTAAYATGDATMQAVSKGQLDLINQSNLYTAEARAAAEKALAEQAKTKDPATQNLTEAQLAANKLAIELQNAAKDAMPAYTSALKQSTTILLDMIKQFKAQGFNAGGDGKGVMDYATTALEVVGALGGAKGLFQAVGLGNLFGGGATAAAATGGAAATGAATTAAGAGGAAATGAATTAGTAAATGAAGAAATVGGVVLGGAVLAGLATKITQGEFGRSMNEQIEKETKELGFSMTSAMSGDAGIASAILHGSTPEDKAKVAESREVDLAELKKQGGFKGLLASIGINTDVGIGNKANADAKAEMDRESARGRGMGSTATLDQAKSLDAAEMGMQSSRAAVDSDGIPTITVGRPQSMGSTALSESLGDMADVLSEDTAQQQEVAQVEQAKATEEAAKKEQERQVFESMAVFLQQMNERMADMVDISRLTADHTERTARGVQ